MKAINLAHINETIYYEKLDNGLDVYLYPKKTAYNNYVTFTTKFGSIYNEFSYQDKTIKTPLGIAHFLEHKVFAQKNREDPSQFFAKSGALSNAYTTFKNTTYLFSGPKNIIENTLYLLDFVQDPYFSDENIESEKGIITQEIHMCDDRPTDVLYEHIRSNTLHNNHFKDSIIGDVEDINSINKKLLETCYTTFYHPSNMFLVVAGNFDENQILEAIKNNQKSKKFAKEKKIEIKKVKEKNSVVKKEQIIKLNTNISKCAYNIKVNINTFDIDKRKLNIYMYIIFGVLFDDSSLFDQEAKDKQLITNSMYINILNCDTHLIISLINETNKYKELFQMIENKLKNINITPEDLERKKKVLISNEIFSFENIEIVNEMIIDSIIFDNHIEQNIIDIIKKLNIEELNSIVSKIDFDNKNTVIIEAK